MRCDESGGGKQKQKKSETASHGTVDISTKEEAIWRKNVQPAGLPVKRGRDPELMCSSGAACMQLSRLICFVYRRPTLR
jgi:hypothetical protein